MISSDEFAKLFAYDDGTPAPPCRMCGRPRRRKNIGTAAEGLSLYCGPKGCDATVRLCQQHGCGEPFLVGPGASKYCPDHTEVI